MDATRYPLLLRSVLAVRKDWEETLTYKRSDRLFAALRCVNKINASIHRLQTEKEERQNSVGRDSDSDTNSETSTKKKNGERSNDSNSNSNSSSATDSSTPNDDKTERGSEYDYSLGEDGSLFDFTTLAKSGCYTCCELLLRQCHQDPLTSLHSTVNSAATLPQTNSASSLTLPTSPSPPPPSKPPSSPSTRRDPTEHILLPSFPSELLVLYPELATGEGTAAVCKDNNNSNNNNNSSSSTSISGKRTNKNRKKKREKKGSDSSVSLRLSTSSSESDSSSDLQSSSSSSSNSNSSLRDSGVSGLGGSSGDTTHGDGHRPVPCCGGDVFIVVADSHLRWWVSMSRWTRQLVRECKFARDLVNVMLSDEGWDVVRQADGITTLYKNETNTPVHSVKMKGVVNCPTFNMAAVMYEADLYSNWIPMCVKSECLATMSKYRKIIYTYSKMPWPMSDREMLMVGFGVDLLEEENLIVITAWSTDETCRERDNIPDHIELPDPQSGTVRMTVHCSGIILRPVSTTQCEVFVMGNCDPKMSVPYSLLNYATKTLAHKGFSMLSDKAINLNAEYTRRIDANTDLYNEMKAKIERAFAKDGDDTDTVLV
eukprot:TRINITY_DN1817_c0_g1_i1.p1 TRINITY_DN1817_c0_g1~~TRINITY_DN1817_c0_g1_i1.p1  ORF type:complete len:599 (-),score=144.57 TRINITY_DN1817_c0_g1_i1:73-1869(-)